MIIILVIAAAVLNIVAKSNNYNIKTVRNPDFDIRVRRQVDDEVFKQIASCLKEVDVEEFNEEEMDDLFNEALEMDREEAVKELSDELQAIKDTKILKLIIENVNAKDLREAYDCVQKLMSDNKYMYDAVKFKDALIAEFNHFKDDSEETSNNFEDVNEVEKTEASDLDADVKMEDNSIYKDLNDVGIPEINDQVNDSKSNQDVQTDTVAKSEKNAKINELNYVDKPEAVADAVVDALVLNEGKVTSLINLLLKVNNSKDRSDETFNENNKMATNLNNIIFKEININQFVDKESQESLIGVNDDKRPENNKEDTQIIDTDKDSKMIEILKKINGRAKRSPSQGVVKSFLNTIYYKVYNFTHPNQQTDNGNNLPDYYNNQYGNTGYNLTSNNGYNPTGNNVYIPTGNNVYNPTGNNGYNPTGNTGYNNILNNYYNRQYSNPAPPYNDFSQSYYNMTGYSNPTGNTGYSNPTGNTGYNPTGNYNYNNNQSSYYNGRYTNLAPPYNDFSQGYYNLTGINGYYSNNSYSSNSGYYNNNNVEQSYGNNLTDINNSTEEIIIIEGCILCRYSGCPKHYKRIGFKCIKQ